MQDSTTPKPQNPIYSQINLIEEINVATLWCVMAAGGPQQERSPQKPQAPRLPEAWPRGFSVPLGLGLVTWGVAASIGAYWGEISADTGASGVIHAGPGRAD